MNKIQFETLEELLGVESSELEASGNRDVWME